MQSFDYLTQAEKAGNKDAYGLLAVHCMKDKKYADGRWPLEKNKEQATIYFQQFDNFDLPCKQELLFVRAMMHLSNGEEEKALQDFNNLELSSLTTEVQDIVIKNKALLPLYIIAKEEQRGKVWDSATIANCLLKLQITMQ